MTAYALKIFKCYIPFSILRTKTNLLHMQSHMAPHSTFPIRFNFEHKSLIHTVIVLATFKDKYETQIFKFHYISCLPNNFLEIFLTNNKFRGT